MRLNFVEAPLSMLRHLRSRTVRIVLIATPAVVVMAAIFTAIGPNLVLGVVLSMVAGVIVASALFIAVDSIAREMADERLLFAHTLEAEQWHARAQRLSPQHHKNGRLYADWYFRLRLQEEVERAKRYNAPFTLLLAKKPGANGRGRASEWLSTTVEQHLRRTDLPAVLRDGSLGIILPHTAHYKAVCDRLTEALASANGCVGLALFPKDGEDASSLLRAADIAAGQAARVLALSAAA
jgi:GGDEF domain-containing protein